MRSSSLETLLCVGLALAAGSGCVSCSRDEAVKVQPEQFPPDWPRPTFETGSIRIGDRTLTIEIADTNVLRRYGCMFIATPPADDRGMLFIYPEPLPLNFWMRNTRVELDLVYIDEDGTILNIHRKMTPFREDGDYRSLKDCRLGLELRGGWCEDHGVWIGQKVEIPDSILKRPAEPQAAIDNIPQIAHP